MLLLVTVRSCQIVLLSLLLSELSSSVSGWKDHQEWERELFGTGSPQDAVQENHSKTQMASSSIEDLMKLHRREQNFVDFLRTNSDIAMGMANDIELSVIN